MEAIETSKNIGVSYILQIPLSDELKQLLEERLTDLKQNPHDVILWEDIKKQDLQVA
jgi:hypothetical protein